MDFQPPLVIFCAIGASAMIVSAMLAVATEKLDNWLDRKTQRLSMQRAVPQRHVEVTHVL
ncbi:hypothetical protein J8I87_08050 [Paraburkholderia sp. LEh10]|uniref:hypothetical protein n=1 Tax=Paraburkholderia sp. LEh10 TaxID=2821353 RepID=UPI001AE61881|nr:hypothetical protein [Paraburkholderia sp. LEh10]MBP0589670.1 hypothetical protein [Paraburkholderia sp. LEh10]